MPVMHVPSRLSKKLQLVLIPLTTPGVARFTMSELTSAGDQPGLAAVTRAAAPATCGDAIDVPDKLALPPFGVADTIAEPGANRSTQVPWLEYDALASLDWVAAAVTADGARAGDVLQAFSFSLPAATATVTPSFTSPAMAWSRAELADPPMLRLATAGTPA